MTELRGLTAVENDDGCCCDSVMNSNCDLLIVGAPGQ